MKKRYIVLGALVLGLALAALGLGAARRSVVGDDRRDFAAETFRGAERGFPYDGAREHYILDIENRGLAAQAIDILVQATPLPKKRGR